MFLPGMLTVLRVSLEDLNELGVLALATWLRSARFSARPGLAHDPAPGGGVLLI